MSEDVRVKVALEVEYDGRHVHTASYAGDCDLGTSLSFALAGIDPPRIELVCAKLVQSLVDWEKIQHPGGDMPDPTAFVAAAQDLVAAWEQHDKKRGRWA